MESRKPLLRGKIHLFAFCAALTGGVLLHLRAPMLKAQLAAGSYALTLMGVFGLSALYHCLTWGERPRRWLRRLDHAMIFIFIGGTYIPFTVVLLSPRFAAAILAIVWGAVAVGILQSFTWVEAPRWKILPAYVVAGVAGVWALPQVIEAAGWITLALVLVGWNFYFTGALIYARRWPNPFPKIFGYHEVWHLFTVGGATAHYSAIALYVIPR